MRVTYHTMFGPKTKVIVPVDVKMSEAQEERMLKTFNRDTRAIEFVGGTTYCINYKSHRLKSSSLDELQMMFKAAWNNLPIPERKCSIHSDNYKPR